MLFLLAITGDAAVFGMDLFSLLFLSAMPLLLSSGRHTYLVEPGSLVACALLIVAIPYAISSGYGFSYMLWPLKAIAMIIFITFARSVGFGIYFKLYLTIFLICLVPFASKTTDGRLNMIFGPNILYRIFGVAFLCGVVSGFYAIKGTWDRIFSVFLLVAGVAGIALTGSIGGVLVVVVLVLFLWITRYKSQKMPKGAIFLSVVWVFISIFIFRENLQLFIIRLSYKLFEGGSSVRSEGWSQLIFKPIFSLFL